VLFEKLRRDLFPAEAGGLTALFMPNRLHAE